MIDKVDSEVLKDIFIIDSKNLYENELVQQCFDIVGVFVAAVDLEGNITLINKKGAQLLESSRKEVLGKNFIHNFIIKDKQKKTKALFDSVIDGSSFYNDNTRYYIKDKKGNTKIIEAKNVTIRDKENKILGILISAKDVTQYLKKQKDLQADLDLYQVLANNIPDINLFLLDKDLNFILAEGKEMNNNDLSREYFEDKKLAEINNHKLQKIWTPLFNSALRGKDIATEYTFNNYYYYIWVIPIFDKHREIQRIVAITQNITEDKRTERKLEKSIEVAEKANQSKTDFLARVSHEIRTPLNAILGFTEQLKQSKLDNQQREHINIIDKSSDHLLSLINDILVLSKIEARQIRFDEVPFKLNYTIKYVYNALLPKAKQKNLEFKYHVDDKLNNVLLGDTFRLRQILINMLGNAIKFTNKGSVELNCYLFRETDEDIKVRFDVTDTGIGITSGNLETIFEKFAQADSTIIKQYGGTGLGLAICKNLIELQNGSLSVSSDVGVGTTFTFIIPYKKGKKEDIIPEDIGEVDSTKLKNKKILLVDDDSFNRILAKTILDKFGCHTEIAHNGIEAITYLENTNYDIILLDIHMQDINGIDVAKFVRDRKNDKSTKILAVTAAVMKDDIKRYYKAGINDFLIKPFKEVNLFNKMCEVMEIINKSDSHQLSSKVILQNTSQKVAYNLSELKKMANGNQAFINNMLITFIENTENTIHLFNQFLQTKDWEHIGEAAHKILPSYRHLEVEEVASKLYELKVKTIVEKSFEEVPGLVQETIKEMENLIKELRNQLD